MTEAEMGVMQHQDKACQGLRTPPEAGNGKEAFYPESQRERGLAVTDFKSLASKSVNKFKPPTSLVCLTIWKYMPSFSCNSSQAL